MFSLANVLTLVADKDKEMLINLFENAPLFVTEQAVVKSLLPNESLIYADQKADTVYFHITGKLTGSDTFDTGVVYNFVELHPIDIIGDFEAFSNIDNYLISIRAITKSTLIAIETKDFLQWMQTDVSALNIICRLLATKLSKELKTNREYLFLDSYDRLLLYIYQLCEKFNNGAPVIFIHKKRTEIADETSFSIKTVNRAINKLVNNEFIASGRNVIKITQEQFLLMQKYVQEHDWL